MIRVNGFWTGTEELPLLAQLTIKSYMGWGCEFVLWSYDQPSVPPGCCLQDAGQIVPECKIFRLKGGTHDGNLAFFGDYFQMSLLNEVGGWWTHMDVECNRRLDTLDKEPYVFAPHYACFVGAYAMKCPPRTWLCQEYLRKFETVIHPVRYRWHDSMSLMGKLVIGAGLGRFIQSPNVLPDDSHIADIKKRRRSNGVPSALRTSHTLYHWCNSVIGPTVADYDRHSYFHNTLMDNGVLTC